MKTNARKNETRKPQDAYIEAHAQTVDLAETVRNMAGKVFEGLFDMPIPDDEDRPINWQDVSRVQEIDTQLTQAYANLKNALEVFKHIKY